MVLSRSWARSLGAVLLVGAGLLPAGVAGAAGHAPRGAGLRLSRPAQTGGCCRLQIEALGAASVSVRDTERGFTASAGPFVLGRSRRSGSLLVWVWIIERNETNVADPLISGPRNWLLLARDGAHVAFPAAPPHHDVKTLAHADALVADTDPENDGWIAFRLPLHDGPRFTLFWSDCRPGCDQAAGLSAYAPVVDVEVSGRSPDT